MNKSAPAIHAHGRAIFPLLLIAPALAGCLSAAGLVDKAQQAAAAGAAAPAPAAPAATYETLASTAPKTSTLGGFLTRAPANVLNGSETVRVAGTLNHATGALTLQDDKYTFTDPDGIDANGVAEDGAGARFEAFDTASYEYVTAYTGQYTSGGTTYDVDGVVGIMTEAADMPNTGRATYTGIASAGVNDYTQDSYGTGNRAFALQNGVSTVNADFAAGTVDVTMNNFTAREFTGIPGNEFVDASATTPVDTIRVTGMTIAGNSFTGGTLVTERNGAAVNITGPNTITQSAGGFFGQSGGIPDEVAGGVTSEGNNGSIYAGYIAD